MATTKKKKEHCFFALFDRFIADSKNSKRLQPNGKKLSPGTIKNYYFTKSLLATYCAKKNRTLRIKEERYLNHKERLREKGYWKKFYTGFTQYLYTDKGYFDNYAGQNIKNIKVFFNYLNKDLALGVGMFHKQFYTWKEDIAIFPLMPEELHFLIYNKVFEASLSTRLQEAKDFFVFGCTVALRFSDLTKLTKANLRMNNGNYYLAVRSAKTSSDSLVKLPA